MITVEQAVNTALDYARKLFGNDPARATDFRLEEVEAKDAGSWLITVSFFEGDAVQRAAIGAAGNPFEQIFRGRAAIGIDIARSFKVVEVSSSGEVKSIKMRTIVLDGLG